MSNNLEYCDCVSTCKFTIRDKIRIFFSNLKFKFEFFLRNRRNERLLKRCIKSNSNIIQHAINEFKLAGWMNENNKFTDEDQGFICLDILSLLEVMSGQGHSGFSASYTLNLFKDLASYEIITPLTGSDDEWFEYSDGNYQNIRCSHVFKNSDGFTYDIDARIFSENGNKENTFTNNASRVFVEFPYSPEREYVHLDGKLTDEMKKQYIQQELDKWEEWKKKQTKNN